jgi:hypothetical protein
MIFLLIKTICKANDMEILDYMNAVDVIFKGRLRRMDIGKVTFNTGENQGVEGEP